MKISNGSEIYAELVRNDPERFPGSYTASTVPAGAVPDNLKVNIPGAEFPAIEEVFFPSPVEPLIVTEPAPGVATTQDTIYRWVAGDNPDAITVIAGLTAEREGKEKMHFTCRAKDDGEFTLPEDTLQELEGEFVAEYPYISRSVRSFYVEGPIVLQMYNSYTIRLE